MTFIIVENLRGFFNSRPPLVVFMICLAAFAVALITFAYIVKTKNLPNPDITEDWNTFLEKLSHLKFCVSHNTTSPNLTSPLVKVGELSPAAALESIKDRFIDGAYPDSSHVTKQTVYQSLVGGLPASASDRERNDQTAPPVDETTLSLNMDPGSRHGRINETFRLNIEFVPNHEFVTSSFKSVYLITEISGSRLNLKGGHAEQNILMTASFQTDDIDGNCVKKRAGICLMYVINACVTFSGPATLLPHPRRIQTSNTCPSEAPSAAGSLVRPMSANLLTNTAGKKWCSRGASLAVEYTFDDSLTVLLSQEDRSVINLHLMRTSYFLFVMVVTMFCYAAIKGRPGKVKAVVYLPHEKAKTFTQP